MLLIFRASMRRSIWRKRSDGSASADRPRVSLNPSGLIMNGSNLPCILCVDDEPRVTEGLALILRRDYRAVTAAGGQAALEKIKEIGAPAVILSDMRMPGMDGANLLKTVKRLYPETTRDLLTREPRP